MNKKLLALAIGAAVAMPVAALAEGPTIYGKLNVSVDSVDNGVSTPVNIVDNASRVGIKGEAETSKANLKGLYKVEFGLNADDGLVGGAGSTAGETITQRDIYAGLQGDFGTVKIGQMDTPVKAIQGSVDQFNDTQADMGGYVAGELRAPNVIAYSSPKLGDAFTVHVALWQSDEMPTAGGAASQIGDGTSIAVQYQADSLYLALGMDSELPNSLAVDPSAGATNFSDIMRAVVGYSTDTVEVGFLYQTAEDAVAGGTGEDTSMVLSGAMKSGDWKFKAQYGQTEGDATSNTETFLGVGADYALGQSTTVGGYYATNEDDLGLDMTVLSLGIEQRF